MRVIAGTFRGKKLQGPPEEITRPTSDRAKEGLFNILTHYLSQIQKQWADIIFCDVFAGSGAIGIEAVSRGTQRVFLFEKNVIALKYINRNTAGMPVEIIKRDACFPPAVSKAVDIIFMDPPYNKGLWEKALIAFNQKGWIDSATLIVIESDREVKENIPSPFVLCQERSYGRNKFLFLKREEDHES